MHLGQQQLIAEDKRDGAYGQVGFEASSFTKNVQHTLDGLCFGDGWLDEKNHIVSIKAALEFDCRQLQGLQGTHNGGKFEQAIKNVHHHDEQHWGEGVTLTHATSVRYRISWPTVEEDAGGGGCKDHY